MGKYIYQVKYANGPIEIKVFVGVVDVPSDVIDKRMRYVHQSVREYLTNCGMDVGWLDNSAVSDSLMSIVAEQVNYIGELNIGRVPVKVERRG